MTEQNPLTFTLSNETTAYLSDVVVQPPPQAVYLPHNTPEEPAEGYPLFTCVHGNPWNECCPSEPLKHIDCTLCRFVFVGDDEEAGEIEHCFTCGPRAPWPCPIQDGSMWPPDGIARVVSKARLDRAEQQIDRLHREQAWAVARMQEAQTALRAERAWRDHRDMQVNSMAELLKDKEKDARWAWIAFAVAVAALAAVCVLWILGA